jgi:hypothetical protein
VLGVVGVILALVFIVELVRRRKLRTAYSLLWLFTGAIVLLLVVSEALVLGLAELLGVHSPASMLFAAGILFSLLILLEHSLALSSLWYDKKRLAQENALLEWRIRQLEANVKILHGNSISGARGALGPDGPDVPGWSPAVITDPGIRFGPGEMRPMRLQAEGDPDASVGARTLESAT